MRDKWKYIWPCSRFFFWCQITRRKKMKNVWNDVCHVWLRDGRPRSLRASSPIWASEAGREGSPPAVAPPLACLSRLYFSRYPPNGELARRLKTAAHFLTHAAFIKNEKSKDYCQADSEQRILFFHNNISAGHTSFLQVYRCYCYRCYFYQPLRFWRNTLQSSFNSSSLIYVST